MVMGAVQYHGSLSSMEQQHCRDENLCLYCGEGDHVVAASTKFSIQQCHSSNRNLIGITSILGKQYLYHHFKLLVAGQSVTLVNALVDLGADTFLVDKQ